MPLIFEEKYYNAVRPYLPEDARRVLEQQIPIIQKNVAGDIENFATSFAQHVHQVAEEQLKRTQDELMSLQASIREQLVILKSASDVGVIKVEATKLADAVTAYNRRIAGLGSSLRTGVMTALKTAATGAGLPVGLFS